MDWCGAQPQRRDRKRKERSLDGDEKRSAEEVERQRLHHPNPALACGARAYLENYQSTTGTSVEERLQVTIKDHLHSIATHYPPSPANGHEIYHGQGGVALMHLRLYQSTQDEDQRHQHLESAHAYAKAAWRKCREELDRDSEDKIASFLCGEAGIMALSAVIAHYRKRELPRSKMLKRLMKWKDVSLKGYECEMLYGRSGYLYCLKFVESHIPEQLLPDEWNKAIQEVVRSIILDGRDYSRRRQHPSPLMYKWFHSEYLGAAHGLAGILYCLLFYHSLLDKNDMRYVLGSADYLIKLLEKHGNIPMCDGDRDEAHPVQWCHGAPGGMASQRVVALFCRLHELTGQSKYLHAAETAAGRVWKDGLIKKSISLCHGAVGNAYAFLTLYRYTLMEEYLLQARVFMLWSVTSPHTASLQPDTPYSLFEGMAGRLYGYVDVLAPMQSAFPAFEPPRPGSVHV